jgi:hypothetical protein
MTPSYWFTPRPKNVEHQHPYLVFDRQDRLHFPLTRFAKEACSRLDAKTVSIYLYALCPYFTWLDTNVWQVRMGQNWDVSPEGVRRSVDDYLVQKLQCQIIPQQQGWKYVALTAGTKSTLRIFLAALKMYYQIMREQKLYLFMNPLVDSMSATIAAAIAHMEREDSEQNPPRMPAKSGVEAPQKKPEHRLTDSYYKLEHDEWHPQIIDDSKLPGAILAGGGSSRSSTQGSVMKWSPGSSLKRVREYPKYVASCWVTGLGSERRPKPRRSVKEALVGGSKRSALPRIR